MLSSFLARLRRAGRTNRPSRASVPAAINPVTSASWVVAIRVMMAPKPERAHLDDGRAGDGCAHGFRHSVDLRGSAVAIHGLLGSAADGLEQLLAVVFEAADLTHQFAVMLEAPLRQVVGDPLPLSELRFHHPVDDLVDLLLDLLRCIADDLALEVGLDLGFVHQVESTGQPQRLIEVLHAAALELVQDVVDIGEAVAKLPGHVLAIEIELALNLIDGCEILGQDLQTTLRSVAVGVDQTPTDPERTEELESDALGLVQGLQ